MRAYTSVGAAITILEGKLLDLETDKLKALGG
jgi:hypothetical protein